MNSKTLRRAIADAFPTSYNRWTWRTLLPDFVDIHLTALTLKRMRYEADADRSGEPPMLAAVVQDAILLLAKRQRLPYRFLALSHFVQLHQSSALQVENQRLRSDLAKALQLAEDYDQHSTKAVDYLQQVAIPSPDWTALLRTIYTRYPELGHEQADTETILQTFIDEELRIYQRAQLDFGELLEDNFVNADDQPQPSADLLQAAAALASLRGQTFATLALGVQLLGAETNNLNGLIDTIGGLAVTWRTKADQLLTVSQDFGQWIEQLEAEVKELRRELTAYRKSNNLRSRKN